jgi:hypothetical protein
MFLALSTAPVDGLNVTMSPWFPSAVHCVADGHATASSAGTPLSPADDSGFACRPVVATGLNVASSAPSPTVTHSVAETQVTARIALWATPVSSVGPDHDCVNVRGGAYCSASVS